MTGHCVNDTVSGFTANIAMPRPPRPQIKYGMIVYARWHGDVEFEIVELVQTESPLPHYKCKTWNGRKPEYWIIPKIQLMLELHDENKNKFVGV